MSTRPTELVRRHARVTDDDVARLNLDEALSELMTEVIREPRAETSRRFRCSRFGGRNRASR